MVGRFSFLLEFVKYSTMSEEMKVVSFIQKTFCPSHSLGSAVVVVVLLSVLFSLYKLPINYIALLVYGWFKGFKRALYSESFKTSVFKHVFLANEKDLQ